MAVKPVRCAVIGCGIISGIYFKNMAAMFRILSPVACCDLNEEAARHAAEEHGLKVMTIEEIIADASIELVVNLTTPAAHFPIISQLLRGGKHVYTEKPLATSLADARELCRLADEMGLMLGSAPDTFLGAASQTARTAVDAGLIGEVSGCVATLNRDGGLMAEKYPYTALPGGGIATDVGIYYATTLLNILGPAAEVCGMAATLHPQRRHYLLSRDDFGQSYRYESENLAAGTVRFSSGAIGSFYFNANSTQNEQPLLALYGSEGLLYLPNPNHFGGEVKVLLKGQSEPFVLPHTHAYEENSRGLGAAEMAWALRKGRAPRADKALACHGLELLLGMIESGTTRRHYRMQTTFIRPPALPRGYLGAAYSASQPEAGLAL